MNDINWGIFQVSDLFKVDERGKRLIKENREEGLIPLVTAGENNNGINTFINNPEQKTYFNAITIDMFGNVFYQPSIFKCDDNITVIQHESLNRYNALFLLISFKHLTNKYSYAYQLRPNRISRDIINLPITEDNKPDWDYMERYIKFEQTTSLNEQLKFLNKELNEIVNYKRVSYNTNWKEFRIIDIFDNISRGKRLIKANQSPGTIPYISSTALNNGVDDFISDDFSKNNFRAFKNSITLANSGSVGSSFYHPYRFIASDHVTALNFKGINQYVAQFLITSLGKISNKYSYNREINDSRIRNEKLMLPVDSSNKPDFEFMENYIKSLKYDNIIKAIEFLKEQYKDLL